MGGTEKRYMEIVGALKKCGVDLVVSVPDSWIGKLIEAIKEDRYFRSIAACREEEGVAICVGAALAGKKCAMIMQNAGMLSSGSGINLAKHYRVPLLMLVAYRGDPRDPTYYHIPKGRATEPFLKSFDIAYAIANEAEALGAQVEKAVEYTTGESHPFALLLGRKELL